ncbi:Crp/Fnr family transcriptional regulator [Marinobacter fonticola]|uniref:Crp/Fnr family transcriptional regulator n=1 Tax=Marinobacter fonticola TaxID=2603215 RepID=UPI0011E6BE90|nr:Crp/Fnr family transcriptional regulator [Marinobacter fonticola]
MNSNVSDLSHFDSSLAPLLRKLGKHVSLTPADVHQLQQLVVRKEEFRKGDEVIVRGRHHEEIHVIEEGWASQDILLEDGQICIIGFLLPGDTTEINSSLTPTSDFAVKAITPLKTMRIASKELKKVLAGNPNLTRAFSLVKLGGEAIDRELLINVTAKPAEQRLANLLCELAFRASTVQPENPVRGENHTHAGGKNGQPQANASLKIPLTQAHLARALGLSAVHVNRVVKRLRQEGLVAVTSGNITVLDWSALANFGSFHSHYLTQYQSEPDEPFAQMASSVPCG